MGFWNKLGQVALQAAPYVAAPFTGGASLAMAPMTGRLAQGLQNRGMSAEDRASGVAPTPNALNRIMGGVNQAAGAYGGGRIATNMAGGGGIFGRGGASTPGINPGAQGGGGLMDFARQQMGNQASQGGGRGLMGQIGQNVLGRIAGNRGNGQPTSGGYGGAMNSPYADPQDAGMGQGRGVLQNQGRPSGFQQFLSGISGGQGGSNPGGMAGNGIMDRVRGMLGGGTGTQGMANMFGGNQAVPNPRNASQMGMNSGYQPNENHMGLGPRFDPNSPNLAMAIQAGHRDSQMARNQYTPQYAPGAAPQFQPQMAPMMPTQRRPQQESQY